LAPLSLLRSSLSPTTGDHGGQRLNGQGGPAAGNQGGHGGAGMGGQLAKVAQISCLAATV